MKVLLQRCSQASVSVSGRTIGAIDRGLMLLIGIDKNDSTETLKKLALKVSQYRVFSDEDGKMNLSVKDINGQILAVSQFTLSADTKKGLRPSFSAAAPPDAAETAYTTFVGLLRAEGLHVETGEFGADMQVSLCNDGPVTFLLEA